MSFRTSCILTLVAAALLASGLAAQASTIAPPAGATAIFSDDFNDYTDTAGMKAVWNAQPAGTATLAAGYGLGGGNAAVSNGGQVIQRNFAAIGFTDAQPVVVEYDYWDFTTGSSDRLSVGIRDSNLSAHFELGEDNSYDNGSNYPLPGATVQGYGFRAGSVGAPQGSASGYWLLTMNRINSNGNTNDPKWHHYKLVIGGSYATSSVLLSNGSLYTRTVSLSGTAGDILNNVRLGGPSGVSSTGTGLFDNIQVYVTPEPASLLLIGLGGLLLRRRMSA